MPGGEGRAVPRLNGDGKCLCGNKDDPPGGKGRAERVVRLRD